MHRRVFSDSAAREYSSLATDEELLDPLKPEASLFRSASTQPLHYASRARWKNLIIAVVLILLLGAAASIFMWPNTSEEQFPHKEAIVVLATSTKWLPQLALMSYTLERHSPLRDRVILVPKQYRDSGFPAAGLDILRQRLGWKVRWVEHIAVPRGPKGEQTPGRYKDVMNKIHIFNMTEYAAVAFLDLDGLVVGSLDEAFSALRGSGSKFASVGDATLAKEQVTLAVQAGSMYAIPDAELFESIMTFKEDTTKYNNRLPEQKMLDTFFWGEWLCLPAKFGLQTVFARHANLPNPYLKLRQDARFLHMTHTKPWVSELMPNAMERADQLLWRSTLREAVKHYGLKAEELLQQGVSAQAGPAWDVAALALGPDSSSQHAETR